TFGNVKLGALAGDLRAAFGPLAYGSELQLAWQGVGREPEVREARLPWVETFGQVAPGAPLLYEDSYGRLCLAVNQGSAADRLGLAEELAVVLHRA
ncbi:MAG: SAM hydroxide adenosyltransferase, partial [Candidatus Limnocylindrales bacterium]